MMIDTLAQYSSFWLTLHLFAMVLGLGGATYSDILLMDFLKDLKISKKEASVIHSMSKIILIGIILAFISGFFLFWPESERLLQTPKFLVKVMIFSILTINGFLLHNIILPKLVHFSFHKDHFIKKTINLRHLGFSMGAISFISWYSIFLLGSFKNIPFSFLQLSGAYFLTLLSSISVSLLLERYINKSV